MIILFTDFTLNGPYVGQVKSAIYQYHSKSVVIDLMHDVPMFDTKHASCLLNSFISFFPKKSVFCCVVDPGVGSDRNAIVVKADDRYFVGPDNGLFEYICKMSTRLEYFTITWKPKLLSSTFHGRDIFAPIAASIDRGVFDGLESTNSKNIKRFPWPVDLYEIIYIDPFGNLMTGVRGSSLSSESILELNGQKINYAVTYSNMPEGELCWYVNSNNLVEIGVNLSSAALQGSYRIGMKINIYNNK